MVSDYLDARVLWIEGEDNVEDGLYVVTQGSSDGTKVVPPSQLGKVHDDLLEQVEWVREQ